MYKQIRAVREKFGDFHTVGIPGFGVGLHGTLYTIYDPDEMMKIVRNEGSHPSGIVEKVWVFRRGLRDSGSAMVSKAEAGGGHGDDGYDYGLLGRGEGWKRQRTFLQTGMLDPRAARGFVPGIVAAAEMASKVAPSHSMDMNKFLNLAAFDMFSSFMFGEVTGTTASIANSTEFGVRDNDDNDRFVAAALDSMERGAKLLIQPFEYVASEIIGMKTAQYRKFEEAWSCVREIGLKKIHDFIDRYEKGDLNDMERASYLAGAIRRQEDSEEVSRDEMIELCLFALFVGVDTTSSVTAWNLMHLAMNPKAQDRLHEELSDAVAKKGTGGRINADVLGRSLSPYLSMCLRESHRITPAFAAAIWKSNSKSDVEVHGITIPRGSLVQLSHLSFDPDIIDDPMEYRPERWMAGAVATREGTKSEVIDHPVLKDPFSQGARRCPGSRVATNEIMALVAQLILDWKIEAPSVKSLEDVKYDSSPIKPVIPELIFTAR